MGGAMETWKRYWQMALDPAMHSQDKIEKAKARQRKHLKVIDAAIAAEEAAAKEKKSASPLIWNKRSN